MDDCEFGESVVSMDAELDSASASLSLSLCGDRYHCHSVVIEQIVFAEDSSHHDSFEA
jgi:hypothetical protein